MLVKLNHAGETGDYLKFDWLFHSPANQILDSHQFHQVSPSFTSFTISIVRTVSVIGIAVREATISVPILIVISLLVIIIIMLRIRFLSLVLFPTITITNKNV